MIRSRRKLPAIAVALLALFATVRARAEVRPAALFTDHAVLQGGMGVPVWGRAEPGERVSVSIAGQTATTTADPRGHWRVDLRPIEEAGPHEMTISGTNIVTIRDVLVGEVWLCSGQSNMTFGLNRAENGKRAAATHPQIRLFDVPRMPAGEPQAEVNSIWQRCTPEAASTFSAVAYFFGRDLHGELDAPVGLIHTSWGGTGAKSWTPRETLEDERFREVLERERERVASLPQAQIEYLRRREQWEENRAAATNPADAVTAPSPPAPAVHKNGPAQLYNGMIHPLIPYAIRGVVWYQGESNRFDPNHYRALLPEMIGAWRRAWGQVDPQFGVDFPFIIIQVANYLPRNHDPNVRSVWAEIREVQRITARQVANAGLVVTIDIGDAADIHPRNKHDVGRRAALQALKLVYGKDLVAGGPAYRDITFDAGRATVHFDDVGGGLVARNSGSADALDGFAIAGADQRFYPADAKIVGDTVAVICPQVRDPVAVRYGWADNPPATLYNLEGLPASPFRTDDWPWEGRVQR